ncbi:MAG: protein kinase [Blastocatellia bacterium]|nr:protein kinase [Blastocatellia bacterium]
MKALAQNTLIQNRYLIVQLIGKGGMGEVYLAVDQRLGSAVALKRTFFAGDEMLGAAFEREARTLARMRHPVLPKVSDHFGEGDEQYLVMEHISGDDLAKRLDVAQKPFPLSWVMFWADQLLDALSYLHSHEPPIIHRDIKPQNLKLTDENHVILLDFGLAKNSTGNTNITSAVDGNRSTGSVVGYTPHYAPMEQIRGIGTNPRSDLYSLSATLYQLLTNSVPVDALTRADSMLNDQGDPIKSITAANAEVPDAVSQVILQGMELSQERRFESAREMQKALRRAFASIQNEMSAKTVAFTAADVDAAGNMPMAVSLDKTEVMDFGLKEEAKAAYDSHRAGTSFPEKSGTDSQPRQADLKTEVFIGGSNSLPIPEEHSGGFEHAAEPDAPADNWAPTQDYSAWARENEPAADDNGGFSPQATVPIIALDQHGQSGTGDSLGGEKREESYDAAPPTAAAAVAAAASSPGGKPAGKKKQTGKIVAIFGGLIAFFVLALGAVGGGLYYYNNYYAAGSYVDEEPTPTPEMTPAPTPSPEPTLEAVIDDANANTSDPNTSDELNATTPTPTPASDVRPLGGTPRPTPPTRPTPRPQPTPVRPATPKPTPAKPAVRPTPLQ